jgi:hypothetical protein
MIILSCFRQRHERFKTDFILEMEFDTLGEVVSKEIVLAREGCGSIPYYSFCDDGHDQVYRRPAFVKLNTIDFMSSYENEVFLLDIPPLLQSISYKDYKFDFPWEMDSFFLRNDSDFNQMNFKYGNEFKRKKNRLQRWFKSDLRYNGILTYYLYSIRFDCVYGGKRKLFLPMSSSQTNPFKVCDVYYITKIHSATPLAKSVLTREHL